MATLKRVTKAPATKAGGRKLGVSKKQSAASPARTPAKKSAPAAKANGGGRRMSGAAAKAKSNPSKAAAQPAAKQSAPAKKEAAQPAPKRRKRAPTTATHMVLFELHCKQDADAINITENLWKWLDSAWNGDRLPDGSGLVTVFVGDLEGNGLELPEA
jgi:hypothetical protein